VAAGSVSHDRNWLRRSDVHAATPTTPNFATTTTIARRNHATSARAAAAIGHMAAPSAMFPLAVGVARTSAPLDPSQPLAPHRPHRLPMHHYPPAPTPALAR